MCRWVPFKGLLLEKGPQGDIGPYEEDIRLYLGGSLFEGGLKGIWGPNMKEICVPFLGLWVLM